MLLINAHNSTALPDEPFNGSYRRHFARHFGHEVQTKFKTSTEAAESAVLYTFYDGDYATDDGKFGLFNRVYCHANYRPERIEVKQSATETGWMFLFVNSNDDDGIAPLGVTIDGVNSLIGKHEFDLLNRFLRAAPAKSVNRYALLGLARATFPVRSRLKDWQPFISKCYTVFKERGLDAEKLLRGMR